MINHTGSEAKFTTKTTASSNSDLMDLFIDSLRHIYWAEKHLVKTLPKMTEAAKSTKLKTLLQTHQIQTVGHVDLIEEIFDILGVEAIAKKCDAMEGITKEGEGIIESTKEGTTSRDVGIIMASQKVEHYEIASYSGLVQLATTLGIRDVAEILTQILEEEIKADQLLSEAAKNKINSQVSQQV